MSYKKELRRLKDCVKFKGVLMSEDGGKTWFVYRQDYVTHASSRYGNFKFAEVNLEGLPLKTDFERLKELPIPPLKLMSDDTLNQLSVHNQLVYKIGVILHVIGFDDLQLHLKKDLDSPPFSEIEKEPFREKDKKYDVKGVYGGKLYVFEIHHKGSLIEALVKLNSLDYAWKGLVLVNDKDIQSLKKELSNKQFKDLIYELRVFLRDEIESLYDQCKVRKLNDEEKENLRKVILERQTFIEQILNG